MKIEKLEQIKLLIREAQRLTDEAADETNDRYLEGQLEMLSAILDSIHSTAPRG